MVVVTIFILERFATLTIRDTNFTTFPAACSDWAEEGCTRVVLKKDGCLRAQEIPQTFRIVYTVDNNNDKGAQDQILTCIDSVKGGSLYK